MTDNEKQCAALTLFAAIRMAKEERSLLDEKIEKWEKELRDLTAPKVSCYTNQEQFHAI